MKVPTRPSNYDNIRFVSFRALLPALGNNENSFDREPTRRCETHCRYPYSLEARLPPTPARYGFAAFGSEPETGTGQIFAMSQLTANAATQPKITSLTRRSPFSTPPIFECAGRLPAMSHP
jgi:hypothetical protein